ncbi:MAG TPA: nuclear transport factor 2 family protein [Streptosporangiaceae bacterium]|nr:nuclear transport factor 2 family protein [Streptosporangiaceae bacterium]
MPWFPEFSSAVELARLQTRRAGQADPVGHYVAALNKADARDLETVWPREVVIYDPRAGEVRGHRHVRQFVSQNELWLAGMNRRTQTVASTAADGKAVVELVVHLTQDGREVAWPVAVVAESHDDRSVVFRTYCSQWPLIGRHEVRPPILWPSTDRHPGGIVGQFQDAVAAGDADAAVRAFEPDGYFREPIGPQYTYRGTGELHAYFTECFSAGGGVVREQCAVTEEGARSAVEYNCVRWGGHELPPQAGLGVYERGPDGRLAAVRLYDDVAAPAGRHLPVPVTAIPAQTAGLYR